MASQALQQKSWSSYVNSEPQLFSFKKKKSGRLEKRDNIFCVLTNRFKLEQKKFRVDIRKETFLLVRIKILKEISGRSWRVADSSVLKAGLITPCQMLV